MLVRVLEEVLGQADDVKRRRTLRTGDVHGRLNKIIKWLYMNDEITCRQQVSHSR